MTGKKILGLASLLLFFAGMGCGRRGLGKDAGVAAADALADVARDVAVEPTPEASADAPGPTDTAVPAPDANDAPARDASDAPDPDASDRLDATADADGGEVTPISDTCPRPQTRFGPVAHSTSDPNMTSGTGARAADRLYVFSGLHMTVDDDTGFGHNTITIEAFGLGSGDSLGPPEALLSAPDDVSFYVQDASVSPNGEIALIYTATSDVQGRFFASFFTPSAADASGVALRWVKTVPLDTASSIEGSPQVIWSPTSGAFVVEWKSTETATLSHVRRFRPDGTDAGGSTSAVQTGSIEASEGDCLIGTVGKYVGVAYRSFTDKKPYLIVLDDKGAQVGPPIKVTDTLSTNSVTVGGTSRGFVVTHDHDDKVEATFVPIDANGSAASPPPYATRALFSPWLSPPRFVSDDVNSPGGAGVVILDLNAVRFTYLNADGSKAVDAAIAIPDAQGFYPTITNYRGSFGVSLYDPTNHSTLVAATTCPPP